MKGTGKRRDVCICGQLCGGDEFHAEVSVSGSDGVVTSAHLELATVSAQTKDVLLHTAARGKTCRRGWPSPRRAVAHGD